LKLKIETLKLDFERKREEFRRFTADLGPFLDNMTNEINEVIEGEQGQQ
jgi:hypothetical protein